MWRERSVAGVLIAVTGAVAALGALATGSVPGAAAEGKAGAVIAVIRFQEILQNAEASQGIEAQSEGKRESYRSEISVQENELRQAEQELSRQQTVLSNEAFAQKQQEFQQRVMNVQRNVQMRRRQLQQAIGGAMREIQTKILEIVSELAGERNIDLVVPRSQVVYAEGVMDITEETLRRLNERLPSVTLTFRELPEEDEQSGQ